MENKNVVDLQKDLDLLIIAYDKLIKENEFNSSLNVLKHIDMLRRMLNDG